MAGWCAWSRLQRLGERLPGCCDRELDVLVAVRDGYERRLELRRRQVDAALEHGVEEAAEPLRVALARARRVEDGLGREEDGEHRADAVHLDGDAGGLRRLPQAGGEAGRGLLQARVRRLRQILQR